MFLDTLVAKLDEDATDTDQGEEAQQELENWARTTRVVRRACRERDVLLGVIGPKELENALEQLRQVL